MMTHGSLGTSIPPFHGCAGFGVVTTLTPPPVTSIHPFLHNGFTQSYVPQHPEPTLPTYSTHLVAALPQLNVPQFDGHHPKMWKAKCESYFDVFARDNFLWVKIAAMHFARSTDFLL
jgi:hypothetical protein